MNIRLLALLFAAALNAACGNMPVDASGGSTNSVTDAADNSVVQTASAEPTPAKLSSDDSTGKNYLSYAAGTTIVGEPKGWEKAYYAWTTYNLIDEGAKTSWESQFGAENTSDAVFVFELAEQTLLKKFTFDNAYVTDETKSAKDFKIEISDTSKSDGFQEILAATLAQKKDSQIFSVPKPLPGRWVRVTLRNNFGSKDRIELAEIRAYGEQLTNTAKLENLSGTYKLTSGLGNLHIKQEGGSVIGCYDSRSGVLTGGTEGRLLKANMTEVVNNDATKKEQFVSLISFSSDGKQLLGFIRRAFDKTEGFSDKWIGTKISSEVGECAQIKDLAQPTGASSQMAKDLASGGRVVVYGINFDFNSDKLRDESKTVLNQIVGVLKENKDWKMTIEGHTDNIGGDAFNKSLSEKRAVAVKAFLTGAGIEANRLSAAGMGLAKPIAANETEAGRAQNRRVELVKN